MISCKQQTQNLVRCAEVGVALCLLGVSYMLQILKEPALVEVARLAPRWQCPFLRSALLIEPGTGLVVKPSLADSLTNYLERNNENMFNFTVSLEFSMKFAETLATCMLQITNANRNCQCRNLIPGDTSGWQSFWFSHWCQRLTPAS